jgi:hypothetical protein
MGIEQEPFRKYNLEESKQDVVTIWLNPKDRIQLENAKAILRQTKDSTALKTLADIGFAKLVDDKSVGIILDRFEAFQRRNARIGVVIEDPKPDIPNGKFG